MTSRVDIVNSMAYLSTSIKRSKTLNHPITIVALELFAILAILIVMAFRTLVAQDIGLSDETAYLVRGLDAEQGAWPRFNDGATYSTMYFALGKVINDPIDLYYIGRITASILFVVGVWISARLIAGRVLAWAVAAAVSVTQLPFIWPGVGTPAAGAVIVGLVLFARLRGLRLFALATALFWLAAGSRPEHIWFAATSSLIAVVWLMIVGLKGRREWQSTIASSLVVVCCAIALPIGLVGLYGSPFQGFDRSWSAFAQHYSLRHAQEGESPWLDSYSIVSRTFPGSKSVFDALVTDPWSFTRHVLANFVDIPAESVSAIVGKHSTTVQALGVSSMTGVLIVGISLSIVFNARQSSYSLIATKRKLTDRPVILPLAVLMLAVLAMTIPVLVIFPRAHYLIMPLGGLFVGMALWPRVNSNTKRWVFASTTIVLLLFAAYTFEVARRSATGNAEPTPTASTARWMSDQESTSWRLLGLDWGWHIYVPNLTPLSTETLPQDDETFKQFLTRNRINAVIVTEALRRGAWSATSGFDEFMKNPASYGFERVVADSPVWVRASDVGFGNGQTTNIDN